MVFLSLLLIATIIAIWRAPIIAVRTGQLLQDRQKINDRLYTNKFSVLAVIIGERHAKGYSSYFIMGMNQIPMVFNDNKAVLSKYDVFIKAHKATATTANQNPNLQAYLNDLIVEMGKDLGYTEMSNDWIDQYFYPDTALVEFDARFYQNFDYLADRRKKLQQLQAEKRDADIIH